MRIELPVILARAERGAAALWWYLLAPCMYEQTGLVRVQAAHDLESPLEAAGAHAVSRLFKQCASDIAALANDGSGPP
jgi:hypothetical protein